MEKEEIVREYLKVQESVRAYALSICQDFHLVEDICQEVAVKLIKRNKAYDDSQPFLPWALYITRCETIDYLKKYNRKNCLVLKEDLASLMLETFLDISNHQVIDERAHALESCLKSLNNQHLSIFENKYVDKMSMKQLASKFNRSAVSIQSLLKRLREKLRSCISTKMRHSNG